MFTMSREVRQAMLGFIALFKRRGVARYTGENVMVVEEELQCVGRRLSADGSLHMTMSSMFDWPLVLPNVPINPTPLETLEAVLDKACD
eukprot:scaffold43222_cov23-Cyclotella_meneghiniana.AAC.1